VPDIKLATQELHLVESRENDALLLFEDSYGNLTAKIPRYTLLTGAGFRAMGASAVEAAQGTQETAMPTSRAKALMALFALQYPIFQAPHGNATGPELAAAISGAGAMGALALSGRTPEAARQLVASVRRQTTRPFLVNYILTFDPQSAVAALDAGAPVVQFSWGLPTKGLITAVRSASAKFGVQVGNVDGARAALDLGADYLVCQGTEAGGHVQSSTPLYELLTRVLEEAKQTPVLAAGGIGHGRKIREVLLAGASGAVLGTRFVATQESVAHPDYKNAIIRAHAKDTAFTTCFQDGWPGATHRALRNSTLTRWEAAGCPPVGRRPGEGDVIATRPDGTKVLRYNLGSPDRDLQGAITDFAMHAGQGVDDIKDLPPARDLVGRLWAECLAASRA
jgi:nitronate monooxygenase